MQSPGIGYPGIHFIPAFEVFGACYKIFLGVPFSGIPAPAVFYVAGIFTIIDDGTFEFLASAISIIAAACRYIKSIFIRHFFGSYLYQATGKIGGQIGCSCFVYHYIIDEAARQDVETKVLLIGFRAG
jgi:hypothetical protein